MQRREDRLGAAEQVLLALQGLGGFTLEHFQVERELSHFHRLRIEVHAVDGVAQDLALEPGGQKQRVGFGVPPAPVLFALVGVIGQPLFPVFAHALEHPEQKAPGAARRVEEAELECLHGLFPGEQFAHGLLDDVFHDVARRVINPARLAHLRLVLDHRAAAVRADDLAEKPFVDRAEDFDRDVAEFVTGKVVANLFQKGFEPVVAHHQLFAEVELEQVAVEERDVRGRTTIQRADVTHHRMPQGTARRGQSGVAPAGGRLFAQEAATGFPPLLPGFQQ